MNTQAPFHYPAGSLLRASQICRDPKTGRPGLLPWVKRTWLRKVANGEVAPGRKIGTKTRVWTVEEVLAVAESLGTAADHSEPEALRRGRAALAAKRTASVATVAAAAPSPDQAGPYPAARAPASGASSAHGPKRGPVAEVAA